MRIWSRISAFVRKSLTITHIQENFIPVSSVPYSVGDPTGTEGLRSNVVMAPVMWIMRTFTEAQLIVQRRLDTDVGSRMWEDVADHALEQLIERPNPAYDGDALWKATSVSYVMAGNGYWRKIRNVFGEVIELWYIPHWLLRPVGSSDGARFITHYEYRGGVGEPERIAPRDIVHFRFGLDPENPRMGLSPLRPLLREVWTDDQASQFSETILRNMGVPGLMISPKADHAKPSPAAAKELEQFFETAFSGERRGKPLVMKIPTELTQFGFDPNKLMLANLRDISEERVCAVLGIPAAVVGFGSGLQSTKVGATMRELRRLAWVQCLIPMQKSLAKQVTAQLLPDFVAQLRRFRARFDTSDVSAFQEEDGLLTDRVTKMVASGVLRVDRAQVMLGLEVDPTQQVYLRPTASAPAGPDAPATPAPAPGPDPEDPEGDEPPDDDTKSFAAIHARLRLGAPSNGRHG